MIKYILMIFMDVLLNVILYFLDYALIWLMIIFYMFLYNQIHKISIISLYLDGPEYEISCIIYGFMIRSEMIIMLSF